MVVETTVDIGESVRGKDIYIIQTGTKFVYALHTLMTNFKVTNGLSNEVCFCN